jgi:hypothetical protein
MKNIEEPQSSFAANQLKKYGWKEGFLNFETTFQ